MRGQHYPSATGICEERYAGTKKKQLAARKTQKCKELNEAFLKVIKPGGRLNAFVNAGARMTLNAELQEEVQEKCEAYLQNPGDKRLLRALDEMQEKIEAEQSYKTADGDTNTLNAIDMDEGFKFQRLLPLCSVVRARVVASCLGHVRNRGIRSIRSPIAN